MQAQLKWNRKKVTSMVGTFLNKGDDGFQVPATKVESEKVASTVGTFLKGDSDGFQVSATKLELEKVASTVATFLYRQLAILTGR